MTPPDTLLPPNERSSLTPEQQARVDAFRELMDEKQRRWERLTPEQQKSEVEAWERAMQTVNEERRGIHRDHSDLR